MQFGDDTLDEPDPWRPEVPARQPVPLSARPAVNVPRFGLDRVGALALPAALAVGAVVLVAVFLLRSPGSTVGDAGPLVSGVSTAAPSFAAASGTAAPAPLGGASASATGAAGGVRVYVVGQVRRPGVVSLPGGARVEDAVDAAGGATRAADLAAVNLARPVADGEQIYLTKPGEDPPVTSCGAPAGASGATGSTGAGGAVGAAGGVVDLNSATLEQLDGLPGVGPVLAQRILEWRQQHGRFASVDELGDVSGIGDATLEKLRPRVRV